MVKFKVFFHKKDLVSNTEKYSLFGIPFLKIKTKHSFKKYYLLGVMFYKKKDYVLYETVLKKINHKYKHIFIHFNCSGETYLFLNYVKPPENSIFIATKKYHVDLCRMMQPDIECVYLPNVIHLRDFKSSYKQEYKNKIFYNVLPFSHFINLEDKLNKGEDVHYCEEICKTIGIKYTQNTIYPIISEEVKKSALNKAKRINLNLENFVFICPESQSNKNLHQDYWVNLINNFYEEGYDIFINTILIVPNYGIGKTCFLTFDEAYYIASLSKQIIGLRSGFIETLTSIKNVPITCLYTDFKDRGKLKSIDAGTVLKGFSLKKLPNVNENLINEVIE